MSDEYTPTADEVRDIYTWDRCVRHGRDDSLDTRIFRQQFDRWLESVRAEERERIAQAVESEGHHWSGDAAHRHFDAARIARGEA